MTVDFDSSPLGAFGKTFAALKYDETEPELAYFDFSPGPAAPDRVPFLHLPGNRHLDHGTFRGEPESALGIHRLSLLRPRGLFRHGAYTCALLMKKVSLAFPFAFVAAGIAGALGALVIGSFCIRLTKIYFSMLTLAFSQIVWAIVFKWNSLTGGDTGLIGINFPQFLDSSTRLSISL